MKEPLTVIRQPGCLFVITYAPNSPPPRWYSFTTNNAGYGNYASKVPALSGTVSYCDTTTVPAGLTAIKCTFPAW